ncbi:UDP-N-acetylmuramate dehydrogenase [Propionibacteriaceae bacterium Y2011]|uniref:UDP-N-acetylmuramate dehydrogenase n=1 Tax=Microlunatus sp. Y2014 TaxID=3418488 RepID=UPI003B48412E
MAELLADHTTLRLGGPAARWVEATTTDQVIEAVSEADARGEPVLVLGGGSNLVVGDDGFDGTVVAVRTRGIGSDPASCAWTGAEVNVAAGEVWDDLVVFTLERELAGIEALSGIPGLVGATPIQNVGAYGAEVAQVIARVRTWDRRENRITTFAMADCGFGYRSSRFKDDPDHWVVLDVTFQFSGATLSAPIRYPELARTLGVEVGERVEARAVRDAVLALRRGKGMVLDPADHDTWSAGSFFTNPVLSAADADRLLPPEAPRYPDGNLVKTSAAWLIQHAGFDKGHRPAADPTAPVSLSTKHTLALTNRGGARTADLLGLAREIRAGVADRFGIGLVNEPVMVNCTLANEETIR